VDDRGWRPAVPADRAGRFVGLVNVVNSLGNGYMHALVNNNMPSFTSDMSAEGLPVTDLGAADILRSRERGVPQYNEFRRQLGMAGIERFEDLRCDATTLAKLKRVYGEGREGVEKMDLAVGMLCDRNLPLAGFAVIDAHDLDEAVRLASGTPCAVAYGVVEVWPLEDMQG
jgi:hypothetical protein